MTAKMNDKNRNDEKSSLNYKAGAMSALVIFISSLFMQWFIWFAYEKLECNISYMFITPLILCMMYHGVMLDTGKNGSFSGKFFFIFSIALPLIFSAAITGIMWLIYPDIASFDADSKYSGAAVETIFIYSGRFIYTSLYLLIFSVIDIPLRKKFDGERINK